MNETLTTSTSQTTAPVANNNILHAALNYFPFFLVAIIFYFLVLRPQEKKRQQREKFIQSVKKGEEILTHSGIYGTVVKVDEKTQTAELEISKGVIIKIDIQAISNIFRQDVPASIAKR